MVMGRPGAGNFTAAILGGTVGSAAAVEVRTASTTREAVGTAGEGSPVAANAMRAGISS